MLFAKCAALSSGGRQQPHMGLDLRSLVSNGHDLQLLEVTSDDVGLFLIDCGGSFFNLGCPIYALKTEKITEEKESNRRLLLWVMPLIILGLRIY